MKDTRDHEVSLTLTLDPSGMHTLEFGTVTDLVTLPLGEWTEASPEEVTAKLARFLRINTVKIMYPEDVAAEAEQRTITSRHRDCSANYCLGGTDLSRVECPYYKGQGGLG